MLEHWKHPMSARRWVGISSTRRSREWERRRWPGRRLTWKGRGWPRRRRREVILSITSFGGLIFSTLLTFLDCHRSGEKWFLEIFTTNVCNLFWNGAVSLPPFLSFQFLFALLAFFALLSSFALLRLQMSLITFKGWWLIKSISEVHWSDQTNVNNLV